MKKYKLKDREYGDVEFHKLSDKELKTYRDYDRKYCNYCWDKLYSYEQKTKIFIGIGNVGKTYTWFKRQLKKLHENPDAYPVCYIVDHKDTRDMLLANNGHELISQYQYDPDFSLNLQEWLSTFKSKGQSLTDASGRVICYVLAYNLFKKYKYMQIKVSEILVDEFIPEDVKPSNALIPQKVQSILQTLQKANNQVITVLCANPKTTYNEIMLNYGFQMITPNSIYSNNIAVCLYLTGDRVKYIEYLNLKSTSSGLGSSGDHRLKGIQQQASIQIPPHLEILALSSPIMIYSKGLRLRIRYTGSWIDVYPYQPNYKVYDEYTICRSERDCCPNSIISPDNFKAIAKSYASGRCRFLDYHTEQTFQAIILSLKSVTKKES